LYKLRKCYVESIEYIVEGLTNINKKEEKIEGIYTTKKKKKKKKKGVWPLAVRHVYGHCTRGELLATCKWPHKYTWWIRLTLTAQLATCILHVANMAACIKIHVANVKFIF